MKKLLLIALLPLSAFAQFSDVMVYWDAAKTDTIAAIRGTGTLYSQPFRCEPDMSLVANVSGGDTSNASLDSSKVQLWLQVSTDGVYYTNEVCGTDSVGLDSTFYDRSTKGTNAPDVVDISPSCPVMWGRLFATGLGTNCKAAGDSTYFTVHVLRYNK